MKVRNTPDGFVLWTYFINFAVMKTPPDLRLCVHLLTFFLLLFHAPLAVAEEQADSLWADSSVAMQEVTVYARANRLGDMVPTQRLSGKRLEALSSLSVADAVRYFSGVQLKDYGGVGGLKTLDIRSMGSNHMGVFYDGLQLGNAQNGQVDLGKFSMDNIEEIALYNGQKSRLLQPARDYGNSGTIYITTRRPRFEEGKPWNLRLSYKTGSFGLQQGSALWEQRLTQRVSASLNAEYLHATGRYKFRYRRLLPSGQTAWDTTATRQNGDIASFRTEAALHGTLPTEGKWMLKGYYYNSERGIPGAIVNNVWKHHQRQWDRNGFVQGSLEQRRSERYEYMVKAKYANDFMRYLNPDPTQMYIDNRFRQQEVYLSTAHHLTFNKHWEANLSADWQLNKLEANLVNFARPGRHTWMWVGSAAYELGKFRAMGSLMGTHTMDKVKLGAKPKNHNRLTPALFLSYRQNADFSLRAFYKRMFRMPTFNDLYYTDVGNIALKPETATQYDIGALYSHPIFSDSWFTHLELKGDAYINLIDNKILAIPKGSGQYRWMMMNIGRVRILGAELSAQTVLQPHPNWTLNLQANYTYQRAEDRSDPTDNIPPAGTYGGQIAYIPRHSGSLTACLEWKQWSLNYAFIYAGERWHSSSNIPANYEEPWYTSDITLRRNIKLKHVRLSAALEVNNLLNQQYEVVLNYPMPGRNWKMILKCNF